MKNNFNPKEIKAIIGLGNPGPRFEFTPHNIGFLVLDEIADQLGGSWQNKKNMEIASVEIKNEKILLVKPQTFMNLSGEILPHLQKQGIKQENILVIHDEIDHHFGKTNFKEGGSARGHNGLRSLISHGGDNFLRLRIGVGRPDDETSDIGNFVTAQFKESAEKVEELIMKSVKKVLNFIAKT